MKFSKRLSFSLLFLFFISTFSSTVCATPVDIIHTDLRIQEVPSLGDEVELIVTYNSGIALENVYFHIGIPKEFDVVSGEIEWTGKLEGSYETRLKIVPRRTGKFQIASIACVNKTQTEIGITCSGGGAGETFISVTDDEEVIDSGDNTFGFKLDLADDTQNATFIVISDDSAKSLPGYLDNKYPDSIKEVSFSAPGPGQVEIHACFYFTNNRTGQLESTPNLPVKVIDYCGLGLCDSVKWEGETDVDGCINTGSLANTDEMGTLDIYFEAYTESDVVTVRNYNFINFLYGGKTPVDDDVADGYYAAYFYAPNGQDPAFNVFKVIGKGSNFMHNLNGEYPPKVVVKWYKGSIDGTYYINSMSEIRLSGQYPTGSYSNWDEWDEDVILHEYGHHIMYSYSPDNSNGGCHGWQSNSTIYNCATYEDGANCCDPANCGLCLHSRTMDEAMWLSWSEGWANYFQAAVMNDSVYRDTLWYFGMIVDFELDMEGPSYFVTGKDNEGAVAATLWDIFDSGNDVYDGLSLGSDEIWDVLFHFSVNGHSIYTIEDFYRGWFSCPTCTTTNHGQETLINNILFEHRTYDNLCLDYDLDGYGLVSCGGTDCNDNSANVNPGRSENCANGIDDDCDGKIDMSDEQCLSCDHTSYPACASAYSMADGETKGNMCGDEQYYTITTTGTCNLQWTVSSAGDYALYARSDTRCPSSTYYTCTSDNAAGQAETCSLSSLPAGTYYAIVKGKGGHEPYSINADSVCGCSCTSWANAGCGGGSCGGDKMQQTRSCTPSGCDIQERCVDDPLCGGCTPESGYTSCQDFGYTCGNGITTQGITQSSFSYDSRGVSGTYKWGRYNYLDFLNMDLKCDVITTTGSRSDRLYIYFSDDPGVVDCYWESYIGSEVFRCHGYDIFNDGPSYTLRMSSKGPARDVIYVCAVSNYNLAGGYGCASYYYYTYDFSPGSYVVSCITDADCGGTTPYCDTGTCIAGSMPAIVSVDAFPPGDFRLVEMNTVMLSVHYTDPENNMVQAAVDCGDGSGMGAWTPLSRDIGIPLSCTYPAVGSYNEIIYLTDELHPGDTSVHVQRQVNVLDNTDPAIRKINPPDGQVVNRSYASLEFQVTDYDGDFMESVSIHSPGGILETFYGVHNGSFLTYTWTGLSPGQSYMWYVSAEDAYGAVNYTGNSTFYTKSSLPPSITGKYPNASQVQAYQGRNVTFSVNVTDPDGDELIYAWYVDGLSSVTGIPSYSGPFNATGNHSVSVISYDGFFEVHNTWNVTVKINGDVNGDCVVNIVDLATIGRNFGLPGSMADIDGDGVVKLMDLVIVGKNYGRTC